MQILSWNINGVRAVARKGFADWFGAAAPEILGLQEVRALPEQVHRGSADLTLLGWTADGELAFAEQRGSEQSDFGIAVAVAPFAASERGAVYVAGATFGAAARAENLGEGDILLMRFGATP